jgi:hypothetical protein
MGEEPSARSTSHFGATIRDMTDDEVLDEAVADGFGVALMGDTAR